MTQCKSVLNNQIMKDKFIMERDFTKLTPRLYPKKKEYLSVATCCVQDYFAISDEAADTLMKQMVIIDLKNINTEEENN